MARHEDIDSAVWADPDFEDLPADAKLLYLWSFTNPLCNMAGLYKVSATRMHRDTSLTPVRVEKALEQLVAARFVTYREDWLWIRSRVKYLGNTSPTMARSIAKDIGRLDAAMPERIAFLRKYMDAKWLRDALSDLVRESRSVDRNPDTPSGGMEGAYRPPMATATATAREGTTSNVEGEVDAARNELPAHLQQVFAAVWPILTDVATHKEARLVPAAVASSLARHAEGRNPVEVAENFRFWHLHGNGELKQLKNAAQGFDNFLRTTKQTGTPAGNNGSRSSHEAELERTRRNLAEVGQ